MKDNIFEEALMLLSPNSQWSIKGEVKYENLTWMDVKEKPTKSEIDAEVIRLQAEYDAQAYARARKQLYPELKDQLDMQYWDQVNGTNTWQDAIAKVKADNPKEAE